MISTIIVTVLFKLIIFCCGNTTSCSSGSSCEINSVIHPKLSYCVSKYNNETDYIVGRCPITYGNLSLAFRYSSINEEEKYFCNNSRTGLLCGQCEPGKTLAINSIYFTCIDCTTEGHMGRMVLSSLCSIPSSDYCCSIDYTIQRQVSSWYCEWLCTLLSNYDHSDTWLVLSSLPCTK